MISDIDQSFLLVQDKYYKLQYWSYDSIIWSTKIPKHRVLAIYNCSPLCEYGDIDNDYVLYHHIQLINSTLTQLNDRFVRNLFVQFNLPIEIYQVI